MYAGPAAFLCDLAGWIVGMVETYHVSALAKLIKENCPGIDNLVCFYLVLRPLNLGVGVCETLDVTGRYPRRYPTTVRAAWFEVL